MYTKTKFYAQPKICVCSETIAKQIARQLYKSRLFRFFRALSYLSFYSDESESKNYSLYEHTYAYAFINCELKSESRELEYNCDYKLNQ